MRNLQLTFDWHYIFRTKVSKVEISQSFVAFSECMNFILKHNGMKSFLKDHSETLRTSDYFAHHRMLQPIQKLMNLNFRELLKIVLQFIKLEIQVMKFGCLS